MKSKSLGHRKSRRNWRQNLRNVREIFPEMQIPFLSSCSIEVFKGKVVEIEKFY